MDINPNNIVLDIQNENRVILIDFGCSIPQSDTSQFRGGTLRYSAPEIVAFRRKANICRGSDMWSVGCVLYEWVRTILLLPSPYMIAFILSF